MEIQHVEHVEKGGGGTNIEQYRKSIFGGSKTIGVNDRFEKNGKVMVESQWQFGEPEVFDNLET